MRNPKKKKKFTFSPLIFNFKDNNLVGTSKIITSKNPSSNPRLMQIERNTWLIKYISQHVGIFPFFFFFCFSSISSVPFPSLLYIFSPSFFLFVILEDESGVDVFNEIEQQGGGGKLFVGEMLIQEWQVRRISLERVGM